MLKGRLSRTASLPWDRWRRVGAIAASGLMLFGALGAPAETIAASTASRPEAAALAVQQEDAATPDAAVDEAALAQCLMREWRHSHEEDTDEAIVYRPADYPFPPSRGRIGFEFLAAGYLIFYGIDPADGEVLSPGHWELLSDRRVQIEVNEPEQPRYLETMVIVSCSEDRLEIAR